jgi:predicted permease
MLGWFGLFFSKMGKVDFASGLQTAYRFNSYVGLALASRLGGQSAVTNMAILIALCVPLCNVLAVSTMSKGSRLTALMDILKNPLILGTIVGVVVKTMGIQVPSPLMLTLERLAQAAVSLGLLAVGSGLIFSGLKGNWAVSIGWLAIKLFISPLVAILYAYITQLPQEQAMVLLIFSAIPSASSAYILAARMGGNAPLVACLISLSTVTATVSLPLAFSIAKDLTSFLSSL